MLSAYQTAPVSSLRNPCQWYGCTVMLESKVSFTAKESFCFFFFSPEVRLQVFGSWRCQHEHFLTQKVLKSVVSVTNPKRKRNNRGVSVWITETCPLSLIISRKMGMLKNQVERVCNLTRDEKLVLGA